MVNSQDLLDEWRMLNSANSLTEKGLIQWEYLSSILLELNLIERKIKPVRYELV